VAVDCVLETRYLLTLETILFDSLSDDQFSDDSLPDDRLGCSLASITLT